MITCSKCLEGRHFRCAGRGSGDCACSQCSRPAPRPVARSPREAPVVRSKPRNPSRRVTSRPNSQRGTKKPRNPTGSRYVRKVTDRENWQQPITEPMRRAIVAALVEDGLSVNAVATRLHMDRCRITAIKRSLDPS